MTENTKNDGMEIEARTFDSRKVTLKVASGNAKDAIVEFFDHPLSPKVKHTKTLRRIL